MDFDLLHLICNDLYPQVWLVSNEYKSFFQPLGLKKEEGNGPLFSNLAVS